MYARWQVQARSPTCAHAADLRIGISADVTTVDPHFLASQPNLTAEDVIFSLEFNIKGSPGGFAAYVRMISEKTIVDPLTIRLKTATPYGALPQELNSIIALRLCFAAGVGSARIKAHRRPGTPRRAPRAGYRRRATLSFTCKSMAR